MQVVRNVRVNANNSGPDNKICNTRFTITNFFPKMVNAQFRRSIHQYFVLIGIVQLNRNISANDTVMTWLPLGVVVALSVARDLIDDERRRHADQLVNSRSYTVCRGAGRGVHCRSGDLRVGDVLLLKRDDEIPADCVVLKTSDTRGLCYTQTTNLDGEPDLKPRRALDSTRRLSDEQVQL